MLSLLIVGQAQISLFYIEMPININEDSAMFLNVLKSSKNELTFPFLIEATNERT